MADRFKIVAFGKLSGASVGPESNELAKANVEAEVVQARYATEDELIAAAKDVDVILGGGRLLTRRVIEALPKCRAIITYSVGFDGIDVQAATDNGVLVVNNPATAWCIEEVSNHAIALLLACAKRLVMLDDWTRKGQWSEARKALLTSMPSIHGQTLGLVGCGAIARIVAGKAQCFSMRTVGYDPYLDKSVAAEAGIALTDLPDVLGQSDFVSVHAPLGQETFHLIGENEFRQMKPTAYLINTARGPVVDEKALIRALQDQRIAGAGLDVFEKEPIDSDNPLLSMKNVVVTPHSASYSEAALEMQALNPAQEAARVLNGHWPRNLVNRTVRPKVLLT